MKGLPAVFSRMISASGVAVAMSWRSASATNSATSGLPSARNEIEWICTPCFACSFAASINGCVGVTSLSR